MTRDLVGVDDAHRLKAVGLVNNNNVLGSVWVRDEERRGQDFWAQAGILGSQR